MTQNFKYEKFFKDIGDADQDLRDMALSDFEDYLLTPEIKIDPNAIQKVLQRFQPDETSLNVRRAAIRVVPLLVSRSDLQTQEMILKDLITTVSSCTGQQWAPSTESAALALKASVTKVVESAQQDVAFWQAEEPVFAKIVDFCVSKLNDSTLRAKEVLYTLLNAIVPCFAKAWEETLKDKIAKEALDDLTPAEGPYRLATTCLASISPFLEADALHLLQRQLELGLQQNNQNNPRFIQLCTAMLRTSPEVLRNCSVKIADILLSQIEGVSSEADVTEQIIVATQLLNEVLEAFAEAVKTSWERSANICATLSKVAATYVGETAAVSNEEDDDEDSDYDYYYAGDDSGIAYRLRVNSLRVLTTIVSVSNDEHLQNIGLSVASVALCDENDEVKTQALALLKSLATDRFASSQSFSVGIVETGKRISLLVGVSDKVTSLILVTLDALLSKIRKPCAALLDCVGETTGKLLHAYGTTKTIRFEALKVSEAYLRALLADPNAYQRDKVAKVCEDITSNCAANQPPNVIGAALKSTKIISDAYLKDPDSAICSNSVKKLSLLTQSKDASVAESEAVAVWLDVLEPSHPALPQVVASLEASLSNEKARLASVTALRKLNSPEKAKLFSPSVVEHLGSFITAKEAALKLYATDAVRNLSHLGVAIPTSLATEWMKSPFLSAASVNVIQSFLHLFAQLALADKGLFPVVRDTVLPQAWEYLMKTGPNGEANMVTSIVQGVIEIANAVFVTEALEQDNIIDLVCNFFEHGKLDTARKSMAILALMKGSNASEAKRVVVEKLLPSKDQLLLTLACIGQIGSCNCLDKELIAALLDGVEDRTDERVRQGATEALTAALRNPENVALLKDCVQRSVNNKYTARVYLLQAVQDAVYTHLAANTPLLDPASCKELLLLLFSQSCSEDDSNTKKSASCIGAIAASHTDVYAKMTAEALHQEPPNTLVVASLSHTLTTLTRFEKDVAPLTGVAADVWKMYNRSASAEMRVAVEQVIYAVASTDPSFFQASAFTESKGMVNLIVELKEDSALIQVLDLDSFKHRTDTGLGCRRLAFDCIKAMVKAARRTPELLTYWGSTSELIDALISASNADSNGETCAELNRTAKDILCLLVGLYPRIIFSDAQIDSLTARLENDISGKDSTSSEKSSAKVDALALIDKLLRMAPFAQHKGFQKLSRKALKDELLGAALRQ